jgi:hypothetical protein
MQFDYDTPLLYTSPIPTKPKENMKISSYTEHRASTKNIPLVVVHLVAERKSETNMTRALRNDNCPKCNTEKQEWTGYGKWQGQSYGVSIVVCVCCNTTRTTYKAPTHGRTPIRDDQWAKNKRQYVSRCDDCGIKRTITARTWEELAKQTNHRCKGNKLVNFIAEEHKGLKGKDFPKELFGE